MDMTTLFTQALGLAPPWKVSEVRFDRPAKRLDIVVDFAPGSTFPCPECGAQCKVHDTAEHEWRHLNFFEHCTFLKARQPRTRCSTDGVKQVGVPWARAGSGFSLLFEAFVVELAKAMPMAAVARLVGEHDTRLWRVVKHYVQEALSRLDLSRVKVVGVDETSRARGHAYLTLFVDLQARKVIFIELGRDHGTVHRFRSWLEGRGGKPDGVREFSLDMSPAFIKGILEGFPNAELTFDKFHVIALANAAVDQVRRDEQKACPGLKKTRWLWLRNAKSLSENQRARFEATKSVARKTSRAYRYREMLQGLYEQPDEASARAYLDRWYRSAVRSRLTPVKRVARTVRAHAEGILRWFQSRITNGLLESLSSLVQSAKRAARGYRNPEYMALMIYLRHADLDLKLPAAVGRPTHLR